MSDLIDRILIGNLVDSNGNVHYEDILKLPTIESDKKFGRWISRWEDGQNYYECDQCGHETGLCNDYNYCPSCGARMDNGIRWI